MLRWWDGKAWTVHVTTYPERAAPDTNVEVGGALVGVADDAGDDGSIPGPTATVSEPLTGDMVRQFPLATVRKGYDRLEVDPFRLRLAAELDAGRSPAPLVSRAAFACSVPGYDRQEVERLLARLDDPEGAWGGGTSGSGPWAGPTFPTRPGGAAGARGGSAPPPEGGGTGRWSPSSATPAGGFSTAVPGWRWR